MIMKHHYRTLLLACLAASIFCACKDKVLDEPEEDYKRLFPFTGISKPDNSLEDMNRMPCDPHQALSLYKYPGIDVTEETLEYDVTLRCLYTQPEGSTLARYNLRYIGADKALVELKSGSMVEHGEHLVAGKELVKTFRVRSGYPLYIAVNGVAPRGSRITASISARSVDGLVVVPSLSTDQSQNKEGPNPIPNPYCEYIILP